LDSGKGAVVNSPVSGCPVAHRTTKYDQCHFAGTGRITQQSAEKAGNGSDNKQQDRNPVFDLIWYLPTG
jgi:hypothetical protein